MIVAIDGGVASGKSAVGRRAATALRLPFLDTGLMYRAVARVAADRGIDPTDPAALGELAESLELRIEDRRVWADGVELSDRVYGTELNPILSAVASAVPVRRSLVERQRALAGSGVVMAGRDIGTVVFPEADFKFFLVAGLHERVRRRVAQLERRGESVGAAALSAEVTERDRADSERAVSPLRPAADAEIIETDGMSLEDVVELILKRIRPQ